MDYYHLVIAWTLMIHHYMWFRKFINLDSKADFLGKDILKNKKKKVFKKLMGVKIKDLKKIEMDKEIKYFIIIRLLVN